MFNAITISTMENTEMDENDVPDEFTVLLPQGNKVLGAPGQQIAEVIVERNTNTGNSFKSQRSPVTTATELDINQSDRSWIGIPRWLGGIALLALLLGISTMNLDNSFIQTAYLKIGSDLGDQQGAAWLLQTFQIGVTVSRPFHSFFSDSHGRMKSLITSYCFFAFGLVLCCSSGSLLLLKYSRLVVLSTLAISRLIVGIGSAGMWMLVTIILNDTVGRSKRAAWESVTKMAVIAGQVGGEILGGPFLQLMGWQSAFAIPLTFALVCLILVWWKLRKTPANQPVLVRVDGEYLQTTNLSRDAILGGILLLIFGTCLCLMFHFISPGFSYSGPWMYLLFFSVVLLGPFFVWHQWQTRSKPLVDFRIICESPRWQIFLATFLREGATAGLQFLIPWYSIATGKGPWTRTWLMMALSFGFVAGDLVAHACITKWKTLNGGFIFFETVCALAACVMCFRWRYTCNLWEVGAYIFVFGLGSGAASASYLVGLLEVTRSQEQATVYGSDKLGTDIAVLGSIAASNHMRPALFARRMRSNLTRLLPAREIEELIEICNLDQRCVNKYCPIVRKAVQLSLKQACIGVLILHICCVVISICCAFLTKDINLTEGEPREQRDPLATAEDRQDVQAVRQRTI